MELVSTPHPHRRRPSPVGLVGLALLALAALVLLPQALGLRHALVRDPAMGSTWRGAVALVDDVPGSDLRVGDVVEFRPPTGAVTASVTRRVVGVGDGVATTRGDRSSADDPWRLSLDATFPRVVGRAPYVGRVAEGGPPTAVALLVSVVVLVLALVSCVGVWRRGAARAASPGHAGGPGQNPNARGW